MKVTLDYIDDVLIAEYDLPEKCPKCGHDLRQPDGLLEVQLRGADQYGRLTDDGPEFAEGEQDFADLPFDVVYAQAYQCGGCQHPLTMRALNECELYQHRSVEAAKAAIEEDFPGRSDEFEIVPVYLVKRKRDERTYLNWKDSRVVHDPNILGGEPVFRDSRLSVRQIGGLPESELDNILKDHPNLSKADVLYARIYASCEEKETGS